MAADLIKRLAWYDYYIATDSSASYIHEFPAFRLNCDHEAAILLPYSLNPICCTHFGPRLAWTFSNLGDLAAPQIICALRTICFCSFEVDDLAISTA